jgi:hypothetical protein
VGQRALEIAQHDAQEHILLPVADCEPLTSAVVQLRPRCLADDREALDGARTLAERCANTVAQLLGRAFRLDDDGEIAPDRRHRRHRSIRRQVAHLRGDARILRA